MRYFSKEQGETKYRTLQYTAWDSEVYCMGQWSILHGTVEYTAWDMEYTAWDSEVHCMGQRGILILLDIEVIKPFKSSRKSLIKRCNLCQIL
jgi:hypothetical protein